MTNTGTTMPTEKKCESMNTKKVTISDESILKVSKEVAIKFIEMGRITPATFDETFKSIHTTIENTVKKG